MNKRIILICFTLILILAIISVVVINNNNKKEGKQNVSINSNITNSVIETSENNKKRENIEENIVDNNNEEEVKAVDMIQIKVNNKVLDLKLEDNSSTKAFVEKLKQGDITVNAHEYGDFEKVGSLGFSLPTNDTRITTTPGDLMLYQGNQVTLFYGTNTWSYTRLGRVIEVTESELKNILGSGDVSLVFSIKNK